MRSYHCSNTNGKYQEQESAPLVREFLADTGMTAAQIERVAYLVGTTDGSGCGAWLRERSGFSMVK